MEPVATARTDHTAVAPADPEVGVLPYADEEGDLVTVWQPNAEEQIALSVGGRVEIRLAGALRGQPHIYPMSVGVVPA